jgi:hypothetical protein
MGRATTLPWRTIVTQLRRRPRHNMRTRAGHTGRRSILGRITLLALLASSCGVLAGPSEAETIASMISAIDATHSNLTRAVTAASSSGQTMSAESRQLISVASDALVAFDEAVDDFRGEAALEEAAGGYAQSANLVLDLLEEGNVAVAAEVAATQADVKYTSVAGRLRTRLDALGGPPSSSGTTRVVVVAVIIAGTAALALSRMRPGGDAAEQLPPPPRHPEGPAAFPTSSFPEDPINALSSDLPPIGSQPSPAPEPTGPVRNPEAVHSVKGGLRTVELEGIIEAALATVTNTGWEVAIQCPSVRVLVDPLRMRRLLSNLLLSATAHDAEHLGLVAEIVGDRVEVNVGHDGTLLGDRATGPPDSDIPPEVEHQLTVARQLLAGMHAEVRWSRWRGVSLYTIELVRGPEEVDRGGLIGVRSE